MQISVRMLGGQSITLEVNAETTIRAVKRMIKDKTQTLMGFQRLTWQGKPLQDDSQTIADLGVFREGSIECNGRLAPAQIFIEQADGSDERFAWEGSFPQLRQRIFDRYGILSENQILECCGVTIQDTDDLKDYMMPRKLGVVIQLKLGR